MSNPWFTEKEVKCQCGRTHSITLALSDEQLNVASWREGRSSRSEEVAALKEIIDTLTQNNKIIEMMCKTTTEMSSITDAVKEGAIANLNENRELKRKNELLRKVAEAMEFISSEDKDCLCPACSSLKSAREGGAL
jgi:hypothetical protein